MIKKSTPGFGKHLYVGLIKFSHIGEKNLSSRPKKVDDDSIERGDKYGRRPWRGLEKPQFQGRINPISYIKIKGLLEQGPDSSKV